MRHAGRGLAVVFLLVATARFATAGGQLDFSYGANGFVTIESGPWGQRFYTNGAAPSLDPANADAVLLVGAALTPPGLGLYSAAVTPAGTLLGPSLLGLGTATAFDAFTRIIADPADPSHRVYLAGYRYAAGATPPSAFLVGRFGPLGDTPDPTWGSGAPVVTAIPGTTTEGAPALAIQTDGKLLVAGDAGDGFANVAVARYDTSGALDPGFGTGGTLVIPSGIVQAIALQGDGKILLAGFFVDGPYGGFGIMRL